MHTSSSALTASTTTIGVAIAVPDPWGARLQAYRSALGDDTAGGIPTHVTLMPPHEIDVEAIEALERHLEEASSATDAFRMHLRGTGTFRPVSPVVFVNLVEGISMTEQLAKDCRREPLALHLEFPYHPHVTVAHVADDALLDRAFDELSDFDCTFTVVAFHLYVHDPGLGWKATRDFALAGAAG